MFRMPSTRREYWQQKIAGNQTRDTKNLEALRGIGWRCLTVWECALRGKHALEFDELIERACLWIEEEGADTRELRCDVYSPVIAS